VFLSKISCVQQDLLFFLVAFLCLSPSPKEKRLDTQDKTEMAIRNPLGNHMGTWEQRKRQKSPFSLPSSAKEKTLGPSKPPPPKSKKTGSPHDCMLSLLIGCKKLFYGFKPSITVSRQA
jgi:hypothetical protein